MSGESPVGARTARAAAWAITIRFGRRLLTFGRIGVLAHLLVPEDFGVMGVALLATELLETVTDGGTRKALIQRPGPIDRHLDTVWTVTLVTSAAIGAVLFAAAPFVCDLLEAPDAVAFVRAVALVPVLRGGKNVGMVLYERGLAFARVSTLAFVAALVDLVVSVVLAVLLHSAWALVGGAIAGALTELVLSFVLHPYRPRPAFERTTASELFAFGRWAALARVGGFLAENVDDIFVARMLGTTRLGLYRVAYRIGGLPATEVAYVIHQVTFPAYASLQLQPERLRAAFLRSLRMVSTLSLTTAAVVVALAEPLFEVVLGSRWTPAADAARLLAVCGGIRSVGAVAGGLFLAVGRPAADTQQILLELGVMLVLLYPLTDAYGMEGAALAMVIAVTVIRMPFLGLARSIIDVPWATFGSYLLPALAGAVSAGLAMAAVAAAVSGLVGLLLAGVAGAVALAAAHGAVQLLAPSVGIAGDMREVVSSIRARR